MAGQDKTLRLKKGVVFSRVPASFGARCRDYNLTGKEKDVLIALMAHMEQVEDGAIRLIAGNSSELAKLTGMRAANVRSLLSSLRKKHVIEGENGGPYFLTAQIWKLEETERPGMRPADIGERSGMRPAHCDEGAGACRGMQGRMPGRSPIKKSEEAKNTHKRRIPRRMDYD